MPDDELKLVAERRTKFLSTVDAAARMAGVRDKRPSVAMENHSGR
jgi:hypothetical protein